MGRGLGGGKGEGGEGEDISREDVHILGYAGCILFPCSFNLHNSWKVEVLFFLKRLDSGPHNW